MMISKHFRFDARDDFLINWILFDRPIRNVIYFLMYLDIFISESYRQVETEGHRWGITVKTN